MNILKRIFGVPELPAAAAEDLPKYLPADSLNDGLILAAESCGEVWREWRVDPDGVSWLRRESLNAVESPPEILGLDADGDLPDDVYDVGDDDVLTAFRRECAIKKSQYERGEISGFEASDEDFGDIE
jgi:hypothetical protein